MKKERNTPKNGKKEKMITQFPLKQRGITLLELLVAMVICGILIAGIYRVFVAQSKAYTVQDQVAEVQQNIRNAMEILVRDLRMAGFDDDTTPAIPPPPPIIPNIMGEGSIRIYYEYYDVKNNARYLYRIDYWRDAASSKLYQEVDKNDGSAPERSVLLENVDEINFTYGVDGVTGLIETQDGVMDDRNGDGIIDDNDWVSAATVNGGNLKVVAVRVTLTARPERVNPDLDQVSPRTLISAVTLRNLCLIR